MTSPACGKAPSHPSSRNESDHCVLFGESDIASLAIERAEAAIEAGEGNLGIGFAEGVIDIQGTLFAAAWCAVITQDRQSHLGGGLHVPLSDDLVNDFARGELTEEAVESYLEEIYGQPYQRLVEYATVRLAT